MKKLLVLTLVAGMAIFGTNAFANDFPSATGNLKTGAVAGSAVFDSDVAPNGFIESLGFGIAGGNGGAFGISGAGGIGHSEAKGGVKWGTAGANLTATGGGLTATDSYLIPFPNGLLSIGIGSRSVTQAVAGATADANAKGLIGGVTSEIGGIAAQGTLNGSYLSEDAWGVMKTDGFTGGIAGQGSIGHFEGKALAGSILWFPGSTHLNANVDMLGESVSESERYITFDGPARTEGFNNRVGAWTDIKSSIGSGGLGLACADGGFVAGGAAASLTVQTNQNGGAAAYAVGSYSGSGNLGTNYKGSAVGYTATSITTVNGMKGSINSSAAGMQVTSTPTF